MLKNQRLRHNKQLLKLGHKERARIEAILHRVSREMAKIAKGKLVILENLRGLREHVRYSQKTNRRLHSWPFKRLQFMIEYKGRLLR